jgi:hypothetical protein
VWVKLFDTPPPKSAGQSPFAPGSVPVPTGSLAAGAVPTALEVPAAPTAVPEMLPVERRSSAGRTAAVVLVALGVAAVLLVLLGAGAMLALRSLLATPRVSSTGTTTAQAPPEVTNDPFDGGDDEDAVPAPFDEEPSVEPDSEDDSERPTGDVGAEPGDESAGTDNPPNGGYGPGNGSQPPPGFFPPGLGPPGFGPPGFGPPGPGFGPPPGGGTPGGFGSEPGGPTMDDADADDGEGRPDSGGFGPRPSGPPDGDDPFENDAPSGVPSSEPPFDGGPAPGVAEAGQAIVVGKWQALSGRDYNGRYAAGSTFDSQQLVRSLPAGSRLSLHGLTQANRQLARQRRMLSYAADDSPAATRLTVQVHRTDEPGGNALAELWVADETLQFRWIPVPDGEEALARDWLSTCVVLAQGTSESLGIALYDRVKLEEQALNRSRYTVLSSAGADADLPSTLGRCPLALAYGQLRAGDETYPFQADEGGQQSENIEALAEAAGAAEVRVELTAVSGGNGVKLSVISPTTWSAAEAAREQKALEREAARLSDLIDRSADGTFADAVNAVIQLNELLGNPPLYIPERNGFDSDETYDLRVRLALEGPAADVQQQARQRLNDLSEQMEVLSAMAQDDRTADTQRLEALSAISAVSVVLCRRLDDDPYDNLVVVSEDVVIGDPGQRPEGLAVNARTVR